MKSRALLFISIVLSLTILSCRNSSGKTGNNIPGEDVPRKTAGTVSSPVEMNKAMFLKKVADYEKNPEEFKYLGDMPAIIDFYATWCGPCKQVAPLLSDLAREYSGKLVVYKVDVDKEEELAAAFGIQSIPTLVFIPMKGKPSIAVGALSKAELQRAVSTVLFPKE